MLAVLCDLFDTLFCPFCDLRRRYNFYECVIQCFLKADMNLNFNVVVHVFFLSTKHILPAKRSTSLKNIFLASERWHCIEIRDDDFPRHSYSHNRKSVKSFYFIIRFLPNGSIAYFNFLLSYTSFHRKKSKSILNIIFHPSI